MVLTCRRICIALVVLIGVGTAGQAADTPQQKPRPDTRFGNWLYKKPDPKNWKKTEKNGAIVFSVDLPPGDFCTLTLFAGRKAEPDFQKQFAAAVAADQKEKGTVKIESDTGPQPSKSGEGFDVLTRSMRSETKALHTLHMYVAGHSGDRFDMAAFQTSGEETWNMYGKEAAQFLLSLKLANSLTPQQIKELIGEGKAADAPPPPALPGLDGPAPTPEPAQHPAPAQTPGANVAPQRAQPPANALPAEALPKSNIQLAPPENSPYVIMGAGGVPTLAEKNGKGIDGVKLSQHDMAIGSPSMAIGPDGTIHVAFVEKHRQTFALAVYYRSTPDAGKTWTEAKNLSEDMAGINVGKCYVLVDGHNRVYVIWRAGLKETFSANIDPASQGCANLWYRVLEGGKWSKIIPVHPPGSPQTQNDGSLSYFAATDAAGRVQVVWNTIPDKWHPELTHVSGTYHQHLSGIGNGLVFQETLDGATPGGPREIFLPPVAGQDQQGGYGGYCDGLDTLTGYVDSAGVAHFIAAVTSTHNPTQGRSRYEIIENGKSGQIFDFPDLSYHAWRDIPTLLVDAKGKQHVIALYPAGERPNVRDYLVGSQDEPVIIRSAAPIKGSIDGFQAYQRPGGRMIVLIQANDTGERGTGDNYVTISSGDGKWSTPINVTDNEGRKSFASKQTSPHSNIAVIKTAYPGPGAAAIDNQGHLCLVIINNERGIFANTAFGVELAGGSSSTPTLRFLRF